jgi:hypothetical protein
MTESKTKTTTTQHDSLEAALAAFQAEMPTVHKGKTARVPTKSGPGYSYSYADIADVTRDVMPLLSKHGLSFSVMPSATDNGYEIVGVLMHESKSGRLSGSLPLFGRTSQEIGSSITYARRYLLGCLTGVVTDDDEDGQAATATQERPRREPVSRAASTQKGDTNAMVAEMMATTTKAQWRELWDRYNFGGAPKVIQDQVQQHAMNLPEGDE